MFCQLKGLQPVFIVPWVELSYVIFRMVYGVTYRHLFGSINGRDVASDRLKCKRVKEVTNNHHHDSVTKYSAPPSTYLLLH